jgi:hypothetical protein
MREYVVQNDVDLMPVDRRVASMGTSPLMKETPVAKQPRDESGAGPGQAFSDCEKKRGRFPKDLLRISAPDSRHPRVARCQSPRFNRRGIPPKKPEWTPVAPESLLRAEVTYEERFIPEEMMITIIERKL